ncbi:zinc finger protein 37 [Diachasma alloeum]|uniref:zinc finger protein 37 n=1 Tax=Diachasma alloeum TaxID=454923 RepID=UPI0007381143|nr:zinc finger protein 37 [Diachasma alloeum]XP_015126971.1 zinc finger protein 37 [Diachasma alloeum]
MTKDAEKDSNHCLICNEKIATTSENCVRIFNSDDKGRGKPLAETICCLLDIDITADNVHSTVLCKKCQESCQEFEEMEKKMMEIKQEVSNHYQMTVKEISKLNPPGDECNDHDYLDGVEHHIVEEEEHDEKEIKEDPKTEQPDTKDALDTTMEEHLDEQFLQEDTDHAEQTKMTEVYLDESISIKFEDECDALKLTKAEERKRRDGRKSKGNSRDDAREPIVLKVDNTYTCLICPTDDGVALTGDAKEIVTHMKTAHEARLYICDICGLDFRKRNELSIHLDDHVAKEEGDFQCEVCNRIFSNLRLFRIHRRIHYPQVKSWPCETCGKRYSSRNLLDEHVNTHIGVRPYICETCGKDFASKYTFKAHVKTHEIRPRPFECTQCNKTFLSQQNLNQHEKTHLGVKEYICHQCGKAFGSPHNLEVHNIVHTGYKPYICKMCGKAFARKAEIRDHERTHTGEKPYQCEFCGATFSQRSNLQSHKRATHYNDKRYKCDDCGKGFKRRRLLDYHIKAAHTGERPYKCETCSATFVYPEHFKKHMRIHTGEKPYLCEVCGKAFNSRDNRNAHRFIHSDKKPYECLVCGMGFMRKPLLYAHMQSQGHLNDTIVVNQPRLTTEEDQVILPEGDVELMLEEDADELGETELYVTDLKDHVIIHENQNIYQEESVLDITEEEGIGEGGVQHMVVNNQMTFTEGEVIQCKTNDEGEQVYSYNGGEDGQTIVVSAGAEYKELMSDSKNPVRLVQIRIPSSAGVEEKSWLSLVQQNT